MPAQMPWESSRQGLAPAVRRMPLWEARLGLPRGRAMAKPLSHVIAAAGAAAADLRRGHCCWSVWLVPHLMCWPCGGTQWGDVGGFNGALPLVAALTLWSVWRWGRVSGVNRDVWWFINTSFWLFCTLTWRYFCEFRARGWG